MSPSPWRALLAGLVLVGLAVPAAAAPQPSPGQEPEDPVRVTVTEILPRSPHPGSAVEVKGTLRNTGSHPITGLRVRLQVGDLIEHRGELHDADEDRPPTSPRVGVDLPGTLEPGGTVAFDVRTDVGQLGLSGVGVYPLDVVARGNAGDGTDSLGGSNFRSSAIIGDYETYLTQDVVNYIDAHYRTLATRASRGLTGCLNGGSAAMRLGLLYPGVFSVVAPTDGVYDESLEVWPSDVESLHQLTELPQDISHLELAGLTGWYVQRAAAYAPAPDNPPFYCEAPFRIVDGHGEFVPEVIAKIVEHDAAHEARRYMQQPVRLRGILIQQASREEADYVGSTRDFEKLLTELSIEHEYMEPAGSHCIHPWKPVALKYMTEHLVFQNP